ncbi:serine/threonine protein kinase [Actinomycetospora sp. TBRC 11914]|nr:serine/threonine protein kinase [Actinomycetospora sp. TBRC 11914]
MSTVYRATDTRLDRRVALKVIDPALAGDDEFRARFLDEARNTSAVDHPHVVPLYDVDRAPGPGGEERLYIAMRFVDGRDLASLIGGRPLAPERALRLLDQVADALDAVHAHGLVHLDVKPANVLVEGRAGSEHAYLADFGLTHRGATGHRTGAGDFLGSPTYAAPEHLRGEPVDARTDLYSLGCVLFTCLTGRAPYRGTVTEVIDAHLAGQVPAATAVLATAAAGAPPLGREVDELVRRALAADPAARPGSARELVAAARAALARRPGPPRHPREGNPGADRATGSSPRGAVRPDHPREGNPGADRATGSPPRGGGNGAGPRPGTGPVVGNPRPPTGPVPRRQPPGPPPRRVQAPAAPADLGAFGRDGGPRRPVVVLAVAGAVVVVLLVVLVLALT